MFFVMCNDTFPSFLQKLAGGVITKIRQVTHGYLDKGYDPYLTNTHRVLRRGGRDSDGVAALGLVRGRGPPRSGGRDGARPVARNQAKSHLPLRMVRRLSLTVIPKGLLKC